MKYNTYVLNSQKNNDIYIGSTENLAIRLKDHNDGKVKSTKSNRPWVLLEYYEFETRNQAVKYEKFLKTHQQKEIIKRKYKL